MIVFLNGAFVPETRATVSVFDRGFLYGDGLFETVRLYQGQPFRWSDHMDRLQRGSEFLNVRLPVSPTDLRARLEELVQRNGMTEAVLRIALSRGEGRRGYSPKGADSPTLVMSLHPAPAIDPARPLEWRLMTASLRVVSNDPLARHKSSNKLLNVLARAEAEAQGADEALLLNTSGEIAEAATGNLFWIDGRTVSTTPIESGALPGVTRAVVMEICRSISLPCHEKRISLDALRNSGGVFLTSTGFEVVEVVQLDSQNLLRSALTARIHQAYRAVVAESARRS